MGVYSESLGRILNRSDLTLKAAGAETASTTSSWNELGDMGAMNLLVNITAISGTTPTMLLTIEGTNDLITAYTLARVGANGVIYGANALTDPTNFTTGTYAVLCALVSARYVRSRSVIGGTTPSFTYSVAGSMAG